MSTRLNALRAKRGEIVEKMDALLAGAEGETRELSDAEKDAYTALETDFDKTGAAIAVEEKLLERKASLAKPVAGQAAARASVAAAPRFRASGLKAFTGEGAEETAYRAGQWAMATILGSEKAATWCRENGIVIAKAQSEGINSAGGFMVPTEFSQAIIDLREEYGTFRGYCRPIPMGRDAMTVPRRSAGLTAYWVGENTALTESQKVWDQVQLVAKKLSALTRLSSELDEDAVINIGDDLAAEMAYAFAVAEDAAGWNGDGSTTYGGIRGVRRIFADQVVAGASSYAGAIDAASGHDTFAEIDATDLANVMAKLPKYAERNAKWYVSQVGWALVFQRLVAASGGTSMVDLVGGKPQRSYLGYPVVIDQTLPTTTGDQSDVAMLLFGDLSMAVSMGDRRGFTVKRSDERYFDTDQIGIMATERVDIVVHDLGDATNPGPLVALIGE